MIKALNSFISVLQAASRCGSGSSLILKVILSLSRIKSGFGFGRAFNAVSTSPVHLENILNSSEFNKKECLLISFRNLSKNTILSWTKDSSLFPYKLILRESYHLLLGRDWRNKNSRPSAEERNSEIVEIVVPSHVFEGSICINSLYLRKI